MLIVLMCLVFGINPPHKITENDKNNMRKWVMYILWRYSNIQIKDPLAGQSVDEQAKTKKAAEFHHILLTITANDDTQDTFKTLANFMKTTMYNGDLLHQVATNRKTTGSPK